jgi:hypothetical protein
MCAPVKRPYPIASGSPAHTQSSEWALDAKRYYACVRMHEACG